MDIKMLFISYELRHTFLSLLSTFADYQNINSNTQVKSKSNQILSTFLVFIMTKGNKT